MLHWSDEIQDLLRKATDEIILDADKALDSFVGSLKAAIESIVKKNLMVSDLNQKKPNGSVKKVRNTTIM